MVTLTPLWDTQVIPVRTLNSKPAHLAQVLPCRFLGESPGRALFCSPTLWGKEALSGTAPFTRTCCTRIKMGQLSVTVLGIDKATLGTSSAPLFHHPFSYLGRLLLDHSMGLIWHGMDTNLFELSSRGDRNREIMTGTSESVFVPVARVSWCL